MVFEIEFFCDRRVNVLDVHADDDLILTAVFRHRDDARKLSDRFQRSVRKLLNL